MGLHGRETETDTASTVFGPYRLEGLLGRGGMGEVFRAQYTGRGRVVALKLLPPHLAGDADFTARFRRESRLAARLRDPHVVPIHDFGEIDGRLFIDMRLVEGTDLAALLDGGRGLDPGRAVHRSGRSPPRWTPRTATAWCTATSSRRTSWSPRTTTST